MESIEVPTVCALAINNLPIVGRPIWRLTEGKHIVKLEITWQLPRSNTQRRTNQPTSKKKGLADGVSTKMADKMAAPTPNKREELDEAVCSTPSSTTYSEATSPQTIDTTTEHSPEGEWEEVVAKKTRKKLSLSPKKVTPAKKERPMVAIPQQRRKTPTPPPPKMQRTKSPERQSVKAPEKTAHEKIISAPGRPERPLHEKYDLDEVVTDKLPDGPQYIIIRAYRQQREGEEFNVDLPAYFCRFLNDAKYYFFKGPMSKYFHEANYTDIEGRFKRPEQC